MMHFAPAVFLASVTAAGSALAAPVTVLDMNFDGSFADSAGHVFTAVGNPVISTSVTDDGSAGAMQINPNPNYLTTPASSAFNIGSNDFTLSVSANFTGTISQWAGGVGDWGVSQAYELVFRTDSGRGNTVTPYFIFTDISGQKTVTGNGSGQRRLISDIGISLNSWHDITVNRTGSSLTMDIDGQQVASMVYTGTLDPANDALWIGESECSQNNQDSVCWNHGPTYYLDNISLTVNDPSVPVTPPAAIPEPGSLALLGGGMVMIGGLLRRRIFPTGHGLQPLTTG